MINKQTPTFYSKYKAEILSWLIAVGMVLFVSGFVYAMTHYIILVETVIAITSIIFVYSIKMLVKLYMFNE